MFEKENMTYIGSMILAFRWHTRKYNVRIIYPNSVILPMKDELATSTYSETEVNNFDSLVIT